MMPLDLEILNVIKAIEAAGGKTSVTPDSPEFVKRAFLDMLMECPDCRLTILGKHEGCGN